MNMNLNLKISSGKQRRSVQYKPLLWLLVIPLLNIVYELLNHSGDNVHSLVTSLDVSTPFIPVFIIPYVLWYPFLLGVLVLILRKNVQKYYQTVLALCMGLILCDLIYICFQTMVPRPEVAPNGFLHQLVSLVYASDKPFNCFPSIHVLTSTLMIAGSSIIRWKIRIPIVVVAWSIIASTLFIKQHVIADVIAGMLAAKLVFELSGRLLPFLQNRMATRNAKGGRYENHK
ncbi:inositol phosphorylceramide synthase [Cohnella abietis]|uniref:Inositol phosphorylceramide synthase n=2 Tax=Cohnella abietis TaxID=2507935 RepID=A0A3T1CZY0_9BACL|nr:inositol phosphorylceramide synthase [Cohnella abietis]